MLLNKLFKKKCLVPAENIVSYWTTRNLYSNCLISCIECGFFTLNLSKTITTTNTNKFKCAAWRITTSELSIVLRVPFVGQPLTVSFVKLWHWTVRSKGIFFFVNSWRKTLKFSKHNGWNSFFLPNKWVVCFCAHLLHTRLQAQSPAKETERMYGDICKANICQCTSLPSHLI